jgi:dTDP-4-dehydrorhamnose reductase
MAEAAEVAASEAPRAIPRARGKVLVTGGGGMLAADLSPALEAAGYAVARPKKSQLDIRQAAHVEGVLSSLRPLYVFNCAAFTKVDLCESDSEAAEVNDVAVAGLAAACGRFGCRLVHVSTDFVFDGRKGAPYTEEDRPNPLCAYGATKLAGESHALALPGSLVVRASWLFGFHGGNFVDAILKQAEAGKPLRVVADQIGRPTATTDLAEAIVALVAAGANGIVHFANDGEASWHAFAQEILRQAGFEETEVAAIASADLTRPARRPPYSVLSTDKYEAITGRSPRDFREPLAEYIERRRPRA